MKPDMLQGFNNHFAHKREREKSHKLAGGSALPSRIKLLEVPRVSIVAHCVGVLEGDVKGDPRELVLGREPDVIQREGPVRDAAAGVILLRPDAGPEQGCTALWTDDK